MSPATQDNCFWLCCAFTFVLLLSGCSSFPTLVDIIGPEPYTEPEPPTRTGSESDTYLYISPYDPDFLRLPNIKEPSIENVIRNEYRFWEGTRHAMGGRSSSGTDCSGFVMTIFKKLFDIDLPRTALEQSQEGVDIEKSALQAGDLVFFRSRRYPHHVGVYLSEGEFIHASSSNGVIISELDRGYWARHFWRARRMPQIDDDDVARLFEPRRRIPRG